MPKLNFISDGPNVRYEKGNEKKTQRCKKAYTHTRMPTTSSLLWNKNEKEKEKKTKTLYAYFTAGSITIDSFNQINDPYYIEPNQSSWLDIN